MARRRQKGPRLDKSAAHGQRRRQHRGGGFSARGVLRVFGVLLTCGSAACGSREETTVVFAAASLTDVLPAVVTAVADSSLAARTAYNFAGSSLLARQILEGGPADVFISANAQWVVQLEQDKRITRNRRQPLLRNRLVVAVPRHSRLRLRAYADLTNPAVQRIALADPAHVPAGKYAKASLEKAGFWKRLQPKFIFAPDVRAALAYVEANEADAGIVYATDTRVTSQVETAWAVPDSLQPEIQYWIACLRPDSPEAERLYRLLTSRDARRMFAAYGFEYIGDRKN